MGPYPPGVPSRSPRLRGESRREGFPCSSDSFPKSFVRRLRTATRGSLARFVAALLLWMFLGMSARAGGAQVLAGSRPAAAGLAPAGRLEPSKRLDLAIALPRTLAEALRLLRESKPLVDMFGDRFVLAYTAVKEAEYETFAQVISSWEREHLLLNV